MTAFITYAMLIVMAFLMLTMMSVMLPRAGVAADRIDEVLHTDFTIREATEPKHIETSEGVLNLTMWISHIRAAGSRRFTTLTSLLIRGRLRRSSEVPVVENLRS